MLLTPGISTGYWKAMNSALARPDLGLQLQQVLAIEADAAGGDLVLLAPGQHLGQRALAGAVRAHDGVHLARLDREVDALEDLAALDGHVQVLDLEQWLPWFVSS